MIFSKPKLKKCPIRIAEWSSSIGPSWGLQGSYIDPKGGPTCAPQRSLYWPFVGNLHGAFEGEHVKTMLALHSVTSWGQHNKGENCMGPSRSQLKISTRVWGGIGFIGKMTFGIFIIEIKILVSNSAYNILLIMSLLFFD